MKLRVFLLSLALAALTIGLAGCGTIYSTQDYGSPATRMISHGATKADVFANLGQPNAIYRNGEGEVFFYKHSTGTNILGLYSKINREDTVVVLDGSGNVAWAGTVPVGSGMTILSHPLLDATHPVRSATLLFEPENYTYEADSQ